jgi:tRNA threonylcarbamoyladenosine biosynthesis protein TsaB
MTRHALLALDTSTEYCSVALLRQPPGHAAPAIVARHERTGAVSSARVLPAVRELFDEAGLALADCAAIAFGAGPGSFTGLRTAAGIAQGLAFGLALPVVPVSTLMACAELARVRDPSVRHVLAALDARMDEAYWAEFVWDDATGDWRTLHAAALSTPAALPVPGTPFVMVGNAAAAFGSRLVAAAHASAIDAEGLPHAAAIARIGWRAYCAGRTVPAALAAPDYVRDKVAQTTAEREAARALQPRAEQQ